MQRPGCHDDHAHRHAPEGAPERRHAIDPDANGDEIAAPENGDKNREDDAPRGERFDGSGGGAQVLLSNRYMATFHRRRFRIGGPLRASAAREGQPERDHLLAVANQQDVAGQHRVVPGLALDRREPRDLRELVGGRPDQRQFALLRQHQQQVLVGQQDELAMAVASALPLALAVLEVDAREDAAVEAEGMALVNDEVVEVGLQPDRRPALFDGPSAGSVRDRDAARAARCR